MRNDDETRNGVARKISSRAPESGARPAIEPSSEAPSSYADRKRSVSALVEEGSALFKGLASRKVPRSRRIFVNRTLRMDLVEAVGFDMDYTLAVYHHRRIESLAYRMTTKALVEKKGYPESVLDLAYQPDSVIRGLVIDKQLGNTFKMDRHYHVARVHHGRRPLTKEERVERYRKQKIKLSSRRYVWVDTLFGLPEAALYADLVDLFDKRSRVSGDKVDYAALYDDVREMIDGVHRDGSLKRLVEQDLPYYIMRDPDLGSTLHRLRSSGKRLFLLTNSPWDYTNAVMAFLLDGVLAEYPTWRSYFDLVIVGAKKPSFFGDRNPFRKVGIETGDVLDEDAVVERGAVLEGGNLWALESATGWEGDRVLYVGDHIYGDILRTKRSGMWRTALVVQEVEDEVRYIEARRRDLMLLQQLEELRQAIDDEIAVQKALVADLDRSIERGAALHPLKAMVAACPAKTAGDELQRTHREARANLDKLKRALRDILAGIQELGDDIHRGMNPSWGMVFKEGHENSRFAEQMKAYACVYTGRVSNLLAYSPLRYFRSRPSPMPHERWEQGSLIQD